MLRTLIKQAASVAGMRVFGTGAGVCVTVVLARGFGTEVLGIYSFCITLLVLATVPISNGWAGMLLRSVAKEGHLDGTSRSMARLGIIGAFVVAAAVFIIGIIVLKQGEIDILQMLGPVAITAMACLGITLLADQISALRMASLRGIDRPALAQFPEMIIRPIVLILGISIVWIVIQPTGMVQTMLCIFASVAVAAVLSAAVGQLVLLRISKSRALSVVHRRTMITWFSSAAALAGSAGLIHLNGYIDLLALGKLRGAHDTGLYRAGLQIAMLTNFGYIALNMLASQRFSNLLAKGDRESAAKAALHLSRLALFAALPVPLLLLFGGELAFSFVFGSEFVAAVLPALIISLGICFSAFVGMAHALLIMSHGEFIAIRLSAAALAINIMLCLALIPQFGLVGAASANAAANVLLNAGLWYFARRRTGIDASIIGLAIIPSENQPRVEG